ncbi:MAG TPA: serine hydrolase domain-containing protein [Thermomicrobiales bacterium]|nr:serine hydrolase domain-containing protein [Thermomicrobiales bacterium]
MPVTRRSLITTTAAGIAAYPLTLPVIASAKQSSPASATPVADQSDLESRLNTAMDAHRIPGAIVLIDSPETGTWSAALGAANIETGEPMTTDMYMRIASITKTFTSTMILQLVDQGALTLDDTLASLLPDQADLPNADTITVRHLLTMQSGLPDYVGTNEVLAASMDPAKVDEDYTAAELLEYIKGEPALFGPGEMGMYSNTNYLILGAIADEVTGSSWQELIQTGILDELGLAQTMIPGGPDIPTPSPRGYFYATEPATPAASPEAGVISATPVSATANPGPIDVTRINTSIPASAGAMISTVTDLLTWMTAIRDGALLSPELHEARMSFTDAADLAPDMKYGLGIVQVNGAIGHDGGIEGFRSSMFYVPDSETTIITLANVIPAEDGSDPAGILMETLVGA